MMPDPNKALVRAFVDDILVNGRMDTLTGYFDGDRYVQHNPQIADGLSGLGAALETMAAGPIAGEWYRRSFSVHEQEATMPRGGDHVRVVSLLIVSALSVPLTSQGPPTLRRAVVGGSDERTRELSTEELESVLATGRAVVIDARPHGEYVLGHIPGAVNVDGKAGVAASMYVSDVTAVARLVRGDKAIPLVVYCNGPHCGKSKRLADELLDAGHGDVRRYQLGMPVWRAIGGVCQVELEGIRHVVANDATSVVIDAREPALYHAGTLPRARNIPRSLVLEGKDVGEVRRAKDDGRLPMDDHNTRIIVVGSDSAAARYVAEALTREAFHNVGYFAGAFEDVRQALAQR